MPPTHIAVARLPEGWQTGHPLAIPTVGVRRAHLPSQLPEELAETITRTIFEHRAVLSKSIRLSGILRVTGHRPAALYPRGGPNNFSAYERAFCEVRGGHGFFCPPAFFSGVWGVARKWLLQKRKDRIDKYYQAIESIIGRLRENEECVDEWRGTDPLRKDALSELVKEKLAADESFVIFSMPMAVSSCWPRKTERRQGGACRRSLA